MCRDVGGARERCLGSHHPSIWPCGKGYKSPNPSLSFAVQPPPSDLHHLSLFATIPHHPHPPAPCTSFVKGSEAESGTTAPVWKHLTVMTDCYFHSPILMFISMFCKLHRDDNLNKQYIQFNESM